MAAETAKEMDTNVHSGYPAYTSRVIIPPPPFFYFDLLNVKSSEHALAADTDDRVSTLSNSAQSFAHLHVNPV